MLELLFGLFLIVGLVIIETPIAFAFGAGVLLLACLYGIETAYFFTAALGTVGSFAILAVPLFILAGATMSQSGISDRLIDFVQSALGRVRGALGAITILSCAVFGAISGSGAAAISAIGSIMIPRMVAAGYPREYSAALVGCASIVSLLIPPSIPMIIFALSANLSVAACFLATMIPGILIAASYCVLNYLYVRKRPQIEGDIEATNEAPPVGIVQAGRRAFFALLMPIIMLGGIYSGAFTPTEAAGVVVVYTLMVGFFIYRTLNGAKLFDSLVVTAVQTGSFILIVFFILNLSRILTLENIPNEIAELFLGISENRVVLLLMLNLILLLMGMIIDDVSGGIVAAIALLPVATGVGIDPIHFAAIVGVNLGLGNITPPCAPLLFIASRVGSVHLSKVIGPTMRLSLLGHLPWVFIVTFVPELSLWLPRAMLGA